MVLIYYGFSLICSSIHLLQQCNHPQRFHQLRNKKASPIAPAISFTSQLEHCPPVPHLRQHPRLHHRLPRCRSSQPCLSIPLCRCNASLSNLFILVIIDAFSRWVELYPTKTTTAVESASCIFQHFGRFGNAEVVHTDRGTAFHNELIEELLRMSGTEQSLTTANSSEENGIVERANQEVLRHLNAILFDSRVHDKWSFEQLPMVQRIMNTVEKTSTGVTPAQLILNNYKSLSSQILQSQRVMYPPDTTRPDHQIALSDRMDEWISRQTTLITVARDKQSQTDFHSLVEYDANITEYPVNSYVLFTPPVGRGDKLLPKHRGPYQVIERSTSIYTIESLVDGKRSTTHIHNLRPFNYDPARASPPLVAQHNEQEFVVDSIHGHRGDRTRRSTMEFKVRWTGFGESCDTWEPYKALLHVDKLHEYLRTNRMKTLIPGEHK